MATIVGKESGVGNDFLVSIVLALLVMLLLKAVMMAVFSAAGVLLL